MLTVDFLDGTPVVWELTGGDAEDAADPSGADAANGTAGGGDPCGASEATGERSVAPTAGWDAAGTDGPEAAEGGWRARTVECYRPTLYAVAREGMTGAPDPAACRERLGELRARLCDHRAVCGTDLCSRRPGLRFDEQPVLRIRVDRPRRIRPLAAWLERQGPPGQVPFRAFDVDLSPGFRFCLDRDCSPVPARPPRVLHLGVSRTAAATEDLSALRVGEPAVGPDAVAEARASAEPAGETARDALRTLRDRLARADPDVLSLARGEVLPLVAEAADDHGIDLGLARVPDGWQASAVPSYRQLAGDSTFESYGQRHHSPARYAVPGRAVIDQTNTFFLRETNLAGCVDLVARSRKPLQELSWASIGNVLTAIQIRAARRRNVLVQWRAWRPERFASAIDLHAADRGGTIFSPAVGLHENVVELDFASLYPNIIRTHNLSPETVRCACHDRADVPELGYAVCDEPGFLPSVLQPLIADRAAMKRRLADPSLSAETRTRLAGQASALKWILVSCFGYQGFSNAKFGRIEVHEAINAYAREILLTAKRRLEAGGWRVLHGIVDSLWVTPRPGADPEPLSALTAAIGESVGVRLERERRFEWVAFCALRDGEAGALTRYFGRVADCSADAESTDDPYNYRGIECRQRSTPTWIADCQRALVETLHETREPAAVIARLADWLDDLAASDVASSELLVRQRVTKRREAYESRTRTVAALERTAAAGLDVRPGQDVRYLVVDDDARSADRVRIASEVTEATRYDTDHYRRLAVRAAASVLSPFGWSVHDVRDAVRTGQTVPIAAYDSADR